MPLFAADSTDDPAKAKATKTVRWVKISRRKMVAPKWRKVAEVVAAGGEEAVVEAEEGDSIAAVVVLTVGEVVALHHAEVVTTAVIVTDPVVVDLLPSWKAMVN